jgi:PIN domain nuclease of toxin-antitoxin system
MRLLLDTHIVLWMAEDSKKLTRVLRKQLDAADSLYCSTASLWECVIKQATGKLDVDLDALDDMLKTLDIETLDIKTAHIAELRSLPPIHRDPFDRMIFAQSRAEGMRLLSVDPIFSDYAAQAYR